MRHVNNRLSSQRRNGAVTIRAEPPTGKTAVTTAAVAGDRNALGSNAATARRDNITPPQRTAPMSPLERLAYAAAGLALVLGGLVSTELASSRRPVASAPVVASGNACTVVVTDCLRPSRPAGG